MNEKKTPKTKKLDRILCRHINTSTRRSVNDNSFRRFGSSTRARRSGLVFLIFFLSTSFVRFLFTFFTVFFFFLILSFVSDSTRQSTEIVSENLGADKRRRARPPSRRADHHHRCVTVPTPPKTKKKNPRRTGANIRDVSGRGEKIIPVTQSVRRRQNNLLSHADCNRIRMNWFRDDLRCETGVVVRSRTITLWHVSCRRFVKNWNFLMDVLLEKKFARRWYRIFHRYVLTRLG